MRKARRGSTEANPPGTQSKRMSRRGSTAAHDILSPASAAVAAGGKTRRRRWSAERVPVFKVRSRAAARQPRAGADRQPRTDRHTGAAPTCTQDPKQKAAARKGRRGSNAPASGGGRRGSIRSGGEGVVGAPDKNGAYGGGQPIPVELLEKLQGNKCARAQTSARG